jgi:hypothetical protein
MTALSQANIPAAFRKSAVQFRVSESDFLLMSNMGFEQQFAANLSNFYIQSRASMSIW